MTYVCFTPPFENTTQTLVAEEGCMTFQMHFDMRCCVHVHMCMQGVPLGRCRHQGQEAIHGLADERASLQPSYERP